jgi:hypothetical protein
VKIGPWYKADQAYLKGIPLLPIGQVRTLRDPTEPFNFRFPDCDWTEKTIAAYKDEVRAEFETTLKIYCAWKEQQIENIRSWDEKSGRWLRHYVRTPEIRQEGHFRYLVLYQVLGVSFKWLAEIARLDRHAVQLGVSKLASRIKLTLRPSGDLEEAD